MKITEESHLDHGLAPSQVEWIRRKFADRAAFFIETVELPEELGTLPCGLHGPTMGDASVPAEEVYHEARNKRAWESRLTWRYPRPTRLVTVVAGPHGDEPCILYTAYGGPQAPQEPDDPGCRDAAGSAAFWAEHALSGGLRNATPHELNILLEDGRIVKLPPTGVVPRVTAVSESMGRAHGIPMVRTEFRVVTDLPTPEEGVAWIVSGMVLDAADEARLDLVATGEPVRDADGWIVGCKGLRRR